MNEPFSITTEEVNSLELSSHVSPTSQKHILPDSRLKDHEWGTIEIDWRLPSRMVRVPCSPVFCANCGKLYGYVPKDNTSFTFWLCNVCYDKYGYIANTYAMPDDEFANKVIAEMEARFGHVLNPLDSYIMLEQGKIGREIEMLLKESPYIGKKE